MPEYPFIIAKHYSNWNICRKPEYGGADIQKKFKVLFGSELKMSQRRKFAENSGNRQETKKNYSMDRVFVGGICVLIRTNHQQKWIGPLTFLFLFYCFVSALGAVCSLHRLPAILSAVFDSLHLFRMMTGCIGTSHMAITQKLYH